MKTSKRVLCVVLLIALTLSLCAVSAYADGTTADADGDKWEIMLVIDGSGSMDHLNGKEKADESDPKGLRYYAVANFLGTLNAENDAVYVGAIVFTANYTNDPTRMRDAIKCNTGLLSMSDPTAKSVIMSRIDPSDAYCVEDMEKYTDTQFRNNSQMYQTDIGTALLTAYQELKDHHHDGYRQAIFLFTDGETEVNPSVIAVSRDNLAEAQRMIRDDGVLLFGVYLNVSKPSTEDNEVCRIVRESNGFEVGDSRINERYLEIRSASDCIKATDMFLQTLGYMLDNEAETITETVDKRFTVPGYGGVSEATIRIFSVDGSPLPEGLKVSFQKPDQTWISDSEANSLCFAWVSSSRDLWTDKDKISNPVSLVYKLQDPEPGEWLVHVEIPAGNSVEIRYSPSFNVDADVGGELVSAVSLASIQVNQDLEMKAYLTRNHERLTDPMCYQNMECTLVYCVDDGAEVEIPMADSGQGYFTGTIPLKDYGRYTVRARFSGKITDSNEDDVSFWTRDAIEWELGNRAPVVQDSLKLSVRYGLFQAKETTLDLSAYVEEPEDGSNLSFRLAGGDCNQNAVRQVQPDGPNLVINNAEIGDGRLVFKVTDTRGNSSDLTVTVETRNMTPIMVLCMAAALLGLLLAFRVPYRLKRQK